YPQSSNLGDDIQSLAGEQFLPRVDRYLDRDGLDGPIDDGPYVTMMNGWYLEHPQHWPPGPAVIPVLSGFHITATNRSSDLLMSGAGREFLTDHQPIGCRDRFTRDLLISHGIEATYVGCPTITFPDRGPAPDADRVFLVQTEGIRVPPALAKNAKKIDQRVASWVSAQTRRQLAVELLDVYRRHARLVITTKLHCALPCAAMGIPVVLFGDPADPRLTPAREAIGINEFRADRLTTTFAGRMRRRRENQRIAREVDWNPKAPDLSEIKTRVSDDFTLRVERAVEIAAHL
ncbi:MAG: hypothetical protein ACJAR2_000030, partial [Ilumatobacter sp.]